MTEHEYEQVRLRALAKMALRDAEREGMKEVSVEELVKQVEGEQS